MSLFRAGAVPMVVIALGTGLVSAAVIPAAPESVTFDVQSVSSASLLGDGSAGAVDVVAGAADSSWWDDVVGFGLYQMESAAGHFDDGDLTFGTAVFGAGLANVLVYGPQASLLVGLAEATGENVSYQWLPYGYPLSFTSFEDWGDLSAFVQGQFDSGFDSISSGLEQLGDGSTVDGMMDLLWGIDELTVNLSLGLLVGSTALLDGGFDV